MFLCCVLRVTPPPQCKEAELVAKAAGDAKRIANAVLPLGKGVRIALGHVAATGAADAFAIQAATSGVQWLQQVLLPSFAVKV